jgi:hypothetical protein
MLDAIYGLSWAWSSVNPVTLVWWWRRLVPDLGDHDLQDFDNEEISKFKILDVVYAMRSFENIDQDNVEEWLQSVWTGLQHMMGMDIVNAAAKQKGEEEVGGGGGDESEK